MDRTLRAALLAALIAAGSVVFFGLFLGFPTVPTLVTAAVLGAVSAALIWGAARRAETLSPRARGGGPGPDGEPQGPPGGDAGPPT